MTDDTDAGAMTSSRLAIITGASAGIGCSVC